MIRMCRSVVVTAAILVAIGTAGCAGTVPKARFSHEMVTSAHVSSPDSVKADVNAADDVQILPEEKERLAEKIVSRIDERKVANVNAAAPRNYEVSLRLTRYDKGNAFARFMLAGLGQIHIEGTVSVFQMPEHTLVGEFTLEKTFAWGGAYGASTSIEDIENTFADGVAAAVTGQKEEPPKHKT